MGDGDEIFMVCYDVMFTDLNNMTDYRVEWFWLVDEIILFFSVSRFNINGYFKTCILHWGTQARTRARKETQLTKVSKI